MKHTHISAEHDLFDLKLSEVREYWELIFLFTRRSFQVSYKQTILGPLWLLINPLLTSVTYVILFGNIAKLSTEGVPQLLFYMAGNAVWGFFSGRVKENSVTFTNNAYLFGKVYFPRLVIPISDILSGLVRFAIQMLLVLVLYIYFLLKGSVRPDLPMLLTVLPVIAELGLMGMGVGIIISSLTTKYRDLTVLVDFGLQLWMYATPVVYPMSSVGGALRTLFWLNPVTAPVELFRLALFGSGNVCVWSLVWSLVFTAAVVFFGIMIFNKVERTFMDTV
ncbi:MAG: ABC transporter permease [Eubacteriales bacterium]|nr:ABC transporter permease [Eubacteriales bacterium]